MSKKPYRFLAILLAGWLTACASLAPAAAPSPPFPTAATAAGIPSTERADAGAVTTPTVENHNSNEDIPTEVHPVPAEVGPLTMELIKSGKEWHGFTFQDQGDGKSIMKTAEGVALEGVEISNDGSLIVEIEGERKIFAHQSLRVIGGKLWIGWRFYETESNTWSGVQSFSVEQAGELSMATALYPNVTIVRGSVQEKGIIETWTKEGRGLLSLDLAATELEGIQVKGQDYTQKVVNIQVRNYSSNFNDQFGEKSVAALTPILDGGPVVEDGSMDAHARKIQVGLEGGWSRLDIIDSETGVVEEYWQVPIVAEDVGGKVRVSRGLLSVEALDELMQYMVKQPDQRGEAHRGYLDLWLMNVSKIPERPNESIKVGRQGMLLSSQVNGGTKLMQDQVSEQGTASQKIGRLPAEYEDLVFSVILQYWVYRGWPSNVQW